MAVAEDKYFTLKGISTGIYKDRGSKFLAFAHPVSSVEETKAIIEDYRKKYHDARHHCYAYVINYDRSIWRQNDDGEPSGTAGKPILGQINARNLTNTIVVVARYFGGILLGTGGLINAYRTASSEALNNAKIIEAYVYNYYLLRFPYSRMNNVMKILDESRAIIDKQEFTEECVLTAGLRASLSEYAIKKLNDCGDILTEYIKTE